MLGCQNTGREEHINDILHSIKTDINISLIVLLAKLKHAITCNHLSYSNWFEKKTFVFFIYNGMSSKSPISVVFFKRCKIWLPHMCHIARYMVIKARSIYTCYFIPIGVGLKSSFKEPKLTINRFSFRWSSVGTENIKLKRYIYFYWTIPLIYSWWIH